MKKIIVFIFCFLLISCSCSLTKEEKIYYQLIKELSLIKEIQITSLPPVTIFVSLEKVIEEELRYQVIIDNPQIIMNEVKAIVIHDQKTNDIFPSVGIFDEPLTLIPKEKELNTSQTKGLILVGYLPYQGLVTDFDGSFKILIQYQDERGTSHKIYYYQK